MCVSLFTANCKALEIQMRQCELSISCLPSIAACVSSPPESLLTIALQFRVGGCVLVCERVFAALLH
jgi:hypothetical protein